MASLIPNNQRGTWMVQWHDGVKWRRVTVTRKPPGWKKGAALPAKPPTRAKEELAAYQRREDDTRRRRKAAAPQTVAEFLADYQAGYAARQRGASARQLAFAADRFLQFCAREKITRLDAVTPEAVDRYLAARAAGEVTGRNRRGDGAAHGTLKKEAGYLGAAWSYAVKLRRLTDNPWSKPAVPGKPTRGTRSSWTPDEFARLAAAARPWLRTLLTLGVNTGIRASALTRLEWRDVAWAGVGETGFGTITVRPELDKVGLGYSVPMSRGCHDLLAALDPGGAKGDRVLKGQGGKPVNSVSAVGESIHRACRAAGLPRPDSPCHAMRRSFGRWAALGHLTGRPIPLYVVSKWMGHASVTMTELYLDLRHEESQGWMTGEGPATTPGPPP